MMATRDFDGNSMLDLAFQLRDGDKLSTTMLLNLGEGKFEWLTLEGDPDLPDPRSEAWASAGVDQLAALEASVPELTSVLEDLPAASLQGLGVSGEVSPRHWSQCPYGSMCFWQHQN